MTPSDLVDFATRYAAAWSGRDPDAFAALYAEDGALVVNDGEPSRGRAAIAATARAYMQAFPDMRVRLDAISEDGDGATFRWIWTGRNTGPGGTGRFVNLRGHERWTFDGAGRIAESRGHYDEAEYQRQLHARHVTGPETARLLHRALTIDDAEAFHALNSHPDVMRHTGDPPSESVEQARAAIAAYPDFDTLGYGRWGCVLEATGELIGFCGLKYLPELDETDVGYRLLPGYWGRGLATEACAASVHFGLEVLGLPRVIGLVLPENVASMRVLEKVGMRRDGQLETEGLLAWRYAIEAD